MTTGQSGRIILKGNKSKSIIFEKPMLSDFYSVSCKCWKMNGQYFKTQPLIFIRQYATKVVFLSNKKCILHWFILSDIEFNINE